MNADKYEHNEGMSVLKKWGKQVTSRLYDENSGLTDDQKKAIVAILHRIGNPDQDNVLKWSPVPGKLKVVLCFPYALGFACEEGKIPSLLIDLHKPILMIAISNHCFAHLENHLSTDIINGLKPYLQTQGFLSTDDIKDGAYYRTFTIKNSTDAVRIASKAVHYDIVLSKLQYCKYLPDNSFSIVVVYGNQDLSAEQQHHLKLKFAEHTQIVLFTTPPMVDQYEECSSEESKLAGHTQFKLSYPVSKLARHAEDIIRTDRIRTLLSKRQLSVLWKIADNIGSEFLNTPLVLSMRAGMGEVEMLCFLPYFLGKVSTNHASLNLTKPVLIITTNEESMILLRKHLGDKPYLIESGYLQHEELANKALYKTHVVEDHFDAVTIAKINNSHELVLSAQEYYQSFPSDNFSVVVIYKSNLLSRQVEKDIISSFKKTRVILFRIASHKTAEKFAAEVQSRLKYLQQSSEFFIPSLVRYGQYIKEKLFNNSLSILSEQQLLGLRATVDWFVYPDSKHQPARIDSTIESEQAGAMICCLPYMFGWAVSCNLIESSEMNLNKPILVICASTDVLNQLWNLLHVNPFIKNFMTSEDVQDSILYHSYLFNGSEIPADIISALNSNEVVVSPMKCLEKLPDNGFSVVISYSFNSIEEHLQKGIIQKFDRYSQLLFLNVQSDSSQTKTLEYESPLILFGGIIKRRRLFGEQSRLRSQEMNALQTVVKWFSNPDTKDKPLLVVNEPLQSVSHSMIISCLPYMLGWAVEEHVLPEKEIDLNHKCVLILALDSFALDTLRNVLFYPFLVKCGILNPSQVQSGAYYRTKIISDEDNTDFETVKNQCDILVADIQYFHKIPLELVTLVIGYSSFIVDLPKQEEITNKVSGSAKVIFFGGSELPKDNLYDQSIPECASAISNELTSTKSNTFFSKQTMAFHKNSILENHSEFTITKLKKCNEDATTSFSESTHKKCKLKKRKKEKKKSRHIQQSLIGPYYKCTCGKEFGPSFDHVNPFNITGTVPVMAMGMCPHCTISPYCAMPQKNLLLTEPHTEGNHFLAKKCQESDIQQNILTNNYQKADVSNTSPPTKVEFDEKEILATSTHLEMDNQNADSPRTEETTKVEFDFDEDELIATAIRERRGSRYRSNSLVLRPIDQNYSPIFIGLSGEETNTDKVSRTFYLKETEVCRNSKGNQVYTEAIPKKHKLYKCYGSKYYNQLENASGFRKSFITEPKTEPATQPIQILVRKIEDSTESMNVDSETKMTNIGILRHKTMPVVCSLSKNENLGTNLKQCKTIDMTDLATAKENLKYDTMTFSNSQFFMKDKRTGLDKTDQEQQVLYDSRSKIKYLKDVPGRSQGFENEYSDISADNGESQIEAAVKENDLPLCKSHDSSKDVNTGWDNTEEEKQIESKISSIEIKGEGINYVEGTTKISNEKQGDTEKTVPTDMSVVTHLSASLEPENDTSDVLAQNRASESHTFEEVESKYAESEEYIQNFYEANRDDKEILLTNEPNKQQRANSLKLFGHSEFSVLYNEPLRKTEMVDMERISNDKDPASFHLHTFLDENKNEIINSPENTLDKLISHATKNQDSPYREIKYSKHSSDTGCNGNLMQQQIPLKVKELDDLECEELKDEKDNENNQSIQKSISKVSKKSSFISSDQTGVLLSTEILALRTVTSDTPSQQSLETELQDKDSELSQTSQSQKFPNSQIPAESLSQL